MTPEPGPGFADRCAALCPGFRAGGPAIRARKSELLAGELAGRPVLAKRLRAPNAVWAWYFAREVARYRAFAAQPPAVRIPALVAADADILVIERFETPPIATRRRPYAELPATTVHALIAACEAIHASAAQVPAELPPPAVIAELRRRVLEDPTAPVEWVRAGLARCCARRVFGAVTLDHALGALDRHAPVAPCHGDLLLRNAFALPEIALVDWECAGLHIADWDLALLWSQLAASGRAIVEAHVGEGPRGRAFLALAVFALGREVIFLHAFRIAADHAGLARVRDDLASLEARL
ncbi:MAG: phosphotransferase [Kofleriaceae bacterium]